MRDPMVGLLWCIFGMNRDWDISKLGLTNEADVIYDFLDITNKYLPWGQQGELY